MTRKSQVMLGVVVCCLFLAPCQIAQAQPPVYQFKCDPVPVPTESKGQTLSFEFSTEGDGFSLDVWRYPCDQDLSFVIFTVRPDPDSTPRICSEDIVLIQDERQSSSHMLTQNPSGDGHAHCGDVVVDTSFVLFPTYFPSVVIDLQQDFDVHWDLGDNEEQFTVFPYDPEGYEDEDFPDSPGLANDAGLNGMFYDSDNPGHGFEISVNEAGLIIYYFGQTDDGELLWLISDLYAEDLEFGEEILLELFFVDGTFGKPVMPADRWGSLAIQFSNCDNGTALLDGSDGTLHMDLQRLVGLEGIDCN